MDDEAIIKLQITLAHQADEIAALSNELYAQQKELAKLRQQYAELKEGLRTLSDESGAVKDINLETPPPHY